MTDVSLYKIVCLNNKNNTEEVFFIDDSGEPTITCKFCGEGHPHLHNFNPETHHIFKIGSVTYADIVKLINNKPMRII